MAKITISLKNKTATVDGNIVEKYARKLLQEKLKADTPYHNGWSCFLTNRTAVENGTDTEYKFEIWNGYLLMQEAIMQQAAQY